MTDKEKFRRFMQHLQGYKRMMVRDDLAFYHWATLSDGFLCTFHNHGIDKFLRYSVSVEILPKRINLWSPIGQWSPEGTGIVIKLLPNFEIFQVFDLKLMSLVNQWNDKTNSILNSPGVDDNQQTLINIKSDFAKMIIGKRTEAAEALSKELFQ